MFLHRRLTLAVLRFGCCAGHTFAAEKPLSLPDSRGSNPSSRIEAVA